jgi:NAD(P)H-dependent FMN reductase
MSKLKIAVIIGSTRATRFADKPAQYILEKANERAEIDAEIVDLRDFDLPLFNEVASDLWVPSQDPRAIAWQNKIAEFDGYIFVVAEYNRSITGALKNALDQSYKSWNRKPFAAIAYGSVGGARAVEHLRGIGVELQMVSTRSAVHIGGGDFFTVWGGGGNQPISAIEGSIGGSVKDTLDQLVWWGNATKAARTSEASVQAAE